MPRNPAVAAAEAAELDIPLTETATPSFSERAAGLIGTVREHPKTAIAAGAALAAGVAAAIPLARRRGKANGQSDDTGGTATATRRAPARRRTVAKKKG